MATAFLERRLGERSWLVLGAAGNLLRESFDAPPGEELTAPIRFAGGLALRISTSLADFSWSALERERGA